MRRLILDFSIVETRDDVHDLLRERFEFPDYYGKNLDALWDLLMEIHEEMCLDIVADEVLRERLGAYGDKLLITLCQAVKENNCMKIHFSENSVYNIERF